MKNTKLKRIIAITAALFLTAVVIWVFWANTALELNVYVVSGKDIPDGFDGFRIVHISDLHNSETGANNKALLDLINKAEPDIIAITGDTVDSRRTDLDIMVIERRNRANRHYFDAKSTIWHKFSLKICLYPFQ